MQKLSRRQILKAISALPAVSPATSVLAQAANPQPQEWTGFAICDSCNHVPSCGIQFQAQGNNIISIQNWKENPRHWLCSKGMSTLQRLYNPNRLLYPMKRTAPPLRHSLVRISSYAFKNPLKFRKLRNNCNKRCSYKFA